MTLFGSDFPEKWKTKENVAPLAEEKHVLRTESEREPNVSKMRWNRIEYKVFEYSHFNDDWR